VKLHYFVTVLFLVMLQDSVVTHRHRVKWIVLTCTVRHSVPNLMETFDSFWIYNKRT